MPSFQDFSNAARALALAPPGVNVSVYQDLETDQIRLRVSDQAGRQIVTAFTRDMLLETSQHWHTLLEISIRKSILDLAVGMSAFLGTKTLWEHLADPQWP